MLKIQKNNNNEIKAEIQYNRDKEKAGWILMPVLSKVRATVVSIKLTENHGKAMRFQLPFLARTLFRINAWKRLAFNSIRQVRSADNNRPSSIAKAIQHHSILLNSTCYFPPWLPC